MTADRLSQLTWTVEDRRAWHEAYLHARRVERNRRRRARAASDRARYAVENAPAYEPLQDWDCEHGYYVGDGCPDCDVPSYFPAVLGSHSVRVDVFEERGTL